MKRFLLPLAILFTGFYYAHGQHYSHYPQNSPWIYAFKIHPEVVSEIMRGRTNLSIDHLHHKADSIPFSNQGYNTLFNKLQPGYYAITRVENEKLKIQLWQNTNIDIQGIPDKKNTLLFVNVPPGEVTMNFEGETLKYSDTYQSFILPGKKVNGLLTIKTSDEIVYYQLEKKTGKKINTYSLNHKLNQYQLSTTRNKQPFSGYIITSQPRYRPGDTVKVKAFIVDKRGKPLDNSIDLLLPGVKGFQPRTLFPKSPGAYVTEYPIPDSMTLDHGYQWAIRYMGEILPLNGGHFYYEDYVLENVSYLLQPEKSILYEGESLILRASATDANGQPAPDTRMELQISISNFSDLDSALEGKPFVYIPATLADTVLQFFGGKEISFSLPDSIIPRISVNLIVRARFLNSENEAHDTTLILRSYPHKEKKQEPSIQTNPTNPEVALSGKRTRDSVKIELLNPRNLTIQYYFWKERKLMESGLIQEDYQFADLDKSNDSYRMEIVYNWQGEKRREQLLLPVFDKALTIEIQQPRKVAPGDSADILISVKDYLGAPVKGVNLTALTITDQFRTNHIPEIPYLGNKPQIGVNDESVSYSREVNVKTPSFTPEWLPPLRLDTAVFFRLKYPDSVYTHYEPIDHILPQFSPYVFENGKQTKVIMIWVDDLLLYYAGAESGNPYSIVVPGGSHQVRLRTKFAEYRIPKVHFREGHKLEFSINPKNLPLWIDWKLMPESFTTDEIEELNNSMIRVQTSSIPAHRLFLWQDYQTFDIADYYSYEKLVGPLLPHQKINFRMVSDKEDFQREWVMRPSHIYQINGHDLIISKKEFFSPNDRIPQYVGDQEIGELALLPGEIMRYNPSRNHAPNLPYAWGNSGKQSGLLIVAHPYHKEIKSVYLQRPGDNTNFWQLRMAESFEIKLQRGEYRLIFENHDGKFNTLNSIEIKEDQILYFRPETMDFKSASHGLATPGKSGISINPVYSFGSDVIKGVLKDSLSGKPISNAKITLFYSGRRFLVTESDSQGNFIFTGIYGRKYKTLISKKGYQPVYLSVNTGGQKQSGEYALLPVSSGNLFTLSDSSFQQFIVSNHYSGWASHRFFERGKKYTGSREGYLNYANGEYLFPLTPRKSWNIGFGLGTGFISGDVRPQLGKALRIDVGKQLTRLFSLNIHTSYGRTKGLDLITSDGYQDRPNSPWNDTYFPGGINALDGSGTAPEVYYNYQMTMGQLILLGKFDLNHLPSFRQNQRWNISMALGGGIMGYHTRHDLLGVNNQSLYDFSLGNFIGLSFNRRETILNLRSILDSNYETPAETDVHTGKLMIKGKEYSLRPLVAGEIGFSIRLSRRVDLRIAHMTSWANTDLLDGQHQPTRHLDLNHHSTIGLGFKLGKSEESLWWSNPLTEVYSSSQEARNLVKKLTEDTDSDGVPDLYDKEPGTLGGSPVNGQGRSLDSDNDGYPDSEDDEPFSPKGCDVDQNGVAIDSDKDGVPDCFDKEPNSPPGMYFDSKGIAVSSDSSETSYISPYGFFMDIDLNALRSEFSDNAAWEPNLITDANGEARFTLVFPDNVTTWTTHVLAMNDNRQTGYARTSSQASKPVLARLGVPQFALQGDTLNLTGRVVSYESDSLSIRTSFYQEEELLSSRDTILKTFRVDHANAIADADTLNLSYLVQVEGGYTDGEKRLVPVLPMGMEEKSGTFYYLEGDTAIHIDLQADKGPATLRIFQHPRDMLMEDLRWLKSYPHDCNEQIASKLIAFTLEKQGLEAAGQEFRYEPMRQRLIRKLKRNRHEDGSWGWWEEGEGHVWMTAWITRALQIADVESSWLNLSVNWLERQLYFLSSEEQLRVLEVLATAVPDSRYPALIGQLEKETGKNTYQTLRIARIRQLWGDQPDVAKILKVSQKDLLGGRFWGNQHWCWYGGDVEMTLLAYEILRDAKHSPATLAEIRNYLLRRQNKNTIETASVLATILPDLSDTGVYAKDTTSRVSVSHSGQQLIQSFPYTMTISDGLNQPLSLQKSGIQPVFTSVTYQYWNPKPALTDSLFAIHTRLMEKNIVTDHLTAGKAIVLQVKVSVKKEGEYLMLQVPIPAGCTYEEKSQNFSRAVHAEYQKDRVKIFFRHLPEGEYSFDISLQPRYSGHYSLNPAQMEMMYVPARNGNNEVKKVRVNPSSSSRMEP